MTILSCSALAGDKPTPPENSTKKNEILNAYSAAMRDPNNEEAFKTYLSALPTVTSKFGGDTHYLVEGDIRMSADKVRKYIREKAESKEGSEEMQQPKLIVHLDESGERSFWASRNQRQLRYAVIRQTFPNRRLYKKVVADMAAAGADWSGLCPTCGIKFVHVPQYDRIGSMAEFEALARADKLRFIVEYVDSGGDFIASAFFPNNPVRERRVWIDPSYFSPETTFPGRGVLRHELGHTLGYRHEHTRGVDGCYFEDESWWPLTSYDPHSVMHYYCGGAGTPSLHLTRIDREGHRDLYGR
jgi:hypothetical protein